MNEQPLDELLPQGHQDMLKAYHEYMAQASDIINQINESDMKTLHLPLKQSGTKCLKAVSRPSNIGRLSRIGKRDC